MERRSFLATPALAATSLLQAQPAKGRLKQSVCRWCYAKTPIEDLAKAAAERVGPIAVLRVPESSAFRVRFCDTGRVMHKHSADYIKRAKQFAQREILHRLVTAHIPLETEFLVGSFSDSTSAAQTKGWEPIAPGFSWGPAYQEGWYRVKGVVPETMAGQTVALSYANPERAWEDAGQFWDKRSLEGTVWVDGRLVGAMDWTHLNWKLMDKADGGEGVDVFVQTYAPNKETTVYGHEQPRTEKPAEFAGFHLTAIDLEAAQLYVDMTFLISLAEG